MKRAKYAVLTGISLFAIVIGCSGDKITQYIQSKGAIYGRVVSSESGITVAVWQATMIKSTTADDEGYFSITELEPGEYLVKIEAPSGIGREIPNVEVDISRGTNIGDVSLLFPSPLIALSPADSTRDVDPLSALTITSSAQLKLESLEDAVAISPNVQGAWQVSYYSPFRYTFVPSVQFATSTSYTVTIGPSLTTVGGDPWGKSVSFSFTTDEMKLTGTNWWYAGTPTTISPSFTGQLVRFDFNVILDQGTIEDGIAIAPPIDFVVEPSSSYGQGNNVIVRVIGGLVSGTEYQITISRNLRDVLGGQLSQVKIADFSTQRFQVVERSYPNGRVGIPPRLGTYNQQLLGFQYSTHVDLSSAAAAVSIDPPATLTIAGWPSNYFELAISAPEGLNAGTTYTLTIGADLKAVDGAAIGEAEVIEFETQPLLLTNFEVSSGDYYGGGDTTVDPGITFLARVWLNADVDASAFDAAASFDPAIAGFWYLRQNYSDAYLEFFTTTTPSLIPGARYTLTIDGSTPLAGGVGFGTDEVRHFTVNPVSITSLSPSPGSRSASPYQSVEVNFNTPMDHATTEAAFQMRTGDGTPIPGSFSWYDEERLSFRPTSQLTVGGTYFVTVGTGALSQLGPALSEAGDTFFQVGY